MIGDKAQVKYEFSFYRYVPTYVSNIEHHLGANIFLTEEKLWVGLPRFNFQIGNRTYVRTEIYFIHRNIYVRTYTYTTAIAIGGEQPQ